MPRLPQLLALSCLGSVAALLAGRALLERLPPPTPLSSSADLERSRRWSPDPWRRREASLLLKGRTDDPARRAALLAGQGWGGDPLAAVVLKQAALNAEARHRPRQAEMLWRQLLRRFPASPASADALYSLGREQPALRRQLLQRFPAHPAALAAALELAESPEQRLQGALHLARWGPRWPGAQERLVEMCRQGQPSAAQRRQLAGGLARVGAGAAAVACLGKSGGLAQAQTLPAADQLALGKALLHGDGDQRRQGIAVLLELVRQQLKASEADAAVRLLADEADAPLAAQLRQLPAPWGTSVPVVALALRPPVVGANPPPPDAPRLEAALALLRRAPTDPASWDLQWELARSELLANRWSAAERLLRAIDPARLPPLLAARQRFWLGFSQLKRGQAGAAADSWRELLRHHPGGYYGWRAALRLGREDLKLDPARLPEVVAPWQPLASGDAQLDRLWRLNLREEAWETWRHQRAGRPGDDSDALLLEGRLRQGVGDDWLGMARLDQAALLLTSDRCDLVSQLEQALHPPRFLELFEHQGRRQGVPVTLLLGLAKQESRFTPRVRSVVGATGLMQLMPETAAELAGGPLSDQDLEDPVRNAELGSRYLAGLLAQWGGDPLAAVASYNAGPGAVAGWSPERRHQEPELWVEAIPYPETRLYVKKVLGNAWSYQRSRRPEC
ncbi:MAG: transglycosylase SLT domain-containing protein [Synechococcaceae cyanobacterium]|nr:transglycosylase SLT domain-containing protein [Synechococcaceae cyanobacterium]